MHKSVESLLGTVIISCQAGPNVPLYGAENMAKMASCALQGGAGGIRACWPQDVAAIRAVCDKPIIGINKTTGKVDYLNDVFITPSLASASEVIEAGADIVALDCTIRPQRGLDELCRLLESIRARHPDIAIMADLATLEEAKALDGTGLVDVLSTTLSGHTQNTQNLPQDTPNVQLVANIKESCHLPVNAEGGIMELRDLTAVLQAGADMVTIGRAVTMPWALTQRFVEKARNYTARG